MTCLLSHMIPVGTELGEWDWEERSWSVTETTRPLYFGIDHVLASRCTKEHIVFERKFIRRGRPQLFRLRVAVTDSHLTPKGRELKESYLRRWASLQSGGWESSLDDFEVLGTIAPLIKRPALEHTVYVFSRTRPGHYHSVNFNVAGEPVWCNCPATRRCRHFEIAPHHELWWKTTRRWLEAGYSAAYLGRTWLNTLGHFGFHEALRRFVTAQEPTPLGT